jgi:hypothetical protein
VKLSKPKSFGAILLLVAAMGGLLGLVFVLQGEEEPIPSTPPHVIPPRRALIDEDDLPFAWGSGPVNTEVYEVPHGIAALRRIGLGYERTWINVTEYVYSYTDATLANRAYDELLAKLERVPLRGWDEVPVPSFRHQASETHIVCDEGRINGVHHFSCVYVARYGSLVIDVGGNIFDRRWLTKEQFRDLLIAADEKAVAALEGGPEDGTLWAPDEGGPEL